MVTVDNLTNSYVGLSTDSKPTDARNGSTFIEMDTSKQYAYNDSGSQWVEQESSGGGGGSDSGGGVEKFVITFDISDNSANKTFAEVSSAIAAGQIVEGVVQMPGANAVVPLSFYNEYQVGFVYTSVEIYSNTPVGVVYKAIINSDDSVTLNVYSFNVATNNS